MKQKKVIPTVLNSTKQGIETPLLSGVEASIWSTNMLTALVNGVTGGKWFSLFDKVYAPKTLEIAWQRVLSNKGGAGIDEISLTRFEMNANYYLEELHESLKKGEYQPQAVKRVYIPKVGGQKRPLGIPTVKDRVVQTAIKLVIEPIFEKDFAHMRLTYVMPL